MRATAFSLSFCLLLAGCMKVQDTSTKTLDIVERETSSSWQKIREYLDVGSKPSAKEKSRVQPRYCYSAYHDVICYSSPVAGQENRLLAYQNSSGTGYTIAPAQPHAQLKKEKTAKIKPEQAASVSPTNTMEKIQSGNAGKDSQLEVYGPELPRLEASLPAPPKIASETKRLKEITFDRSELEPKKLVPDRIQ